LLQKRASRLLDLLVAVRETAQREGMGEDKSLAAYPFAPGRGNRGRVDAGRRNVWICASDTMRITMETCGGGNATKGWRIFISRF